MFLIKFKYTELILQLNLWLSEDIIYKNFMQFILLNLKQAKMKNYAVQVTNISIT